MRHWIKKRLLAALRRQWPFGEECGYVSWCATPPAGRSWQVHRFSILEAVELAAAFVYAKAGSCNPLETRLVVGAELADAFMSMPFFVPMRSEGADGICLGYLNSRRIVFDPNLTKRDGLLTFHEEHSAKNYCTRISIID